MATEVPLTNDEREKTTNPQMKRLESQDEWISEEELYTEGSSDEDDMALRMKRREREGMKRADGKSSSSRTLVADEHCRLGEQLCEEETEISPTNDYTGAQVPCEQVLDDDSYLWRPTQGNFKFKHARDTDEKLITTNEERADAEASDASSGSGDPESTTPSLSEAYSNMHKLDALLRDSDRKLKEAQAETLRAQLSTRAQLQQLREKVGHQNLVLSRNWDAFMQLCPTSAASEADLARGARGDHEDQGYSVLPRISGEGEDSDHEDENPNLFGSQLAITDEEKLKLAELLRDVDSEQSGATPGTLGYTLDPEARRCLEDIDGKLQELAPVPATSVMTTRGATRQQRLDDIDRCLQALAVSALGDVEPVGEEEVRRLLANGEGAGEGGPTDPAILRGLLEEARKELPNFRFRHQEPPQPAATADAQVAVER